MQIETGPLAIFQESTVPVRSRLAGWAALVRAFNIQAPVRRPSCVAEHHVRGSQRQEGNWTVFDKRYWPGDSFADHLAFALRHEDIDLLIFKRLCDAAPADAFARMVRAAPSGGGSRRAWYLYEHLTGRISRRRRPCRRRCRYPRTRSLFHRCAPPVPAAPCPRQLAGHRALLSGYPAD